MNVLHWLKRRARGTSTLGARHWAIADGHIPAWSHGPEPEMISHEALCFLNTTPQDAQVTLMVYFTSREPAGPYHVVVQASRTQHVRLNDLREPEAIPHGTDFAVTVDSTMPIVVQHTRLDSRQADNGLFSTIAYHSPA